LAALLEAQGITARSVGQDELLAEADSARIGELAAANRIVLHELSGERATLEDVFLELTGDSSLASPAAPGVPPGAPPAPTGERANR